MTDKAFLMSMYLIAAAFTGAFVVLVVPALIDNPDVLGAFAAGFVNPYAAGYSTDVILCWVALAVLVLHDRQAHSIVNGGWYLLLGIVPGVAVGLALYLASRHKQLAARQGA